MNSPLKQQAVIDKLPVNIDILLFVALPAQPYTLQIGIRVGFVKSAETNRRQR